ncbi:MAG: urea ABC transporter ATP-binding subunit UrtE [Gammaproteobacteria bacterium]|jgi:urea transport system ATP-binding protein|nr:urea ABC transporter ATP-binding subunit UrtE [Gammaproteobacteria bacterium]MBT5201819.1 urea ABC transporter ATP-binding subunit UrtE [Gammaproteobacteria bacterium]MBT5603366.1 urea ABC transporter ATP-binding subunit UrtE [Gammaproteobacteria bacterium]
MLVVENVDQSYGQSQTLWNVNMRVEAGSCVSLIGRNGVGKTTLLNSVMGLLKIDSGTLLFEDNDLARLPAEHRASLRIGYVPQGRMIFPLLTVKENLLTGLGNLPRSERVLPDSIFELFPVLKTMMQRRGGDLSGGQQQQLAIARALVLKPKFLILDEPTEGIQPNIVEEIGDVIIRLNRELGLTVLVVEQKLPFVRRVASHFHIMSKGAVVASDVMSGLTESLIKEHLSV